MSRLPTSSDVVDGSGRIVQLGRKIGEGGEGVVFEIADAPHLVAKIYHRPPSARQAAKIRAMTALRTPSLDRLTAWPIDVLLLSSGVPIGLIMPRAIGYKDIHLLYSPKSRRTEFPKADWRFLVRAAANLARAFATVHETSTVIADVNHSGVFVAPDARIRLIDCDSFQVVSGGERYLCAVGVPTFTPPELQGIRFTELVRTPNHDSFGPAVLVFLILFMGRHPFAGRFSGIREMTIEQAIGDSRFPYGAEAEPGKMERPPGTPPLGIVSAPVAQLFESAFSKDGATKGRPPARLWAQALDDLEARLRQCKDSSSHWHFSGLPVCPWCQMEATTGVPLFSPVLSPGGAAQLDLDAFWAQVATVPHPGPAPLVEDSPRDKRRVAPSAEARVFLRRYWFHVPMSLFAAAVPLSVGVFTRLPMSARLFFFVAAFLLYFLVRRSLKATKSVSLFLERDRRQRARWDEIRNEWETKAGPRAFENKRAELERLWIAWKGLPAWREGKLQALGDRKRDIQLSRFLDDFKIDVATIPGVGVGRKSLLQSFGIETAADVDEQRLFDVPGFGMKLRGAMLLWRRSLEEQFAFDPADTGDVQSRNTVEQEVLAERLRIAAEIRQGFGELQQIANQVQFARTALRARAEDAYRAYLQADADLRAVMR